MRPYQYHLIVISEERGGKGKRQQFECVSTESMDANILITRASNITFYEVHVCCLSLHVKDMTGLESSKSQYLF